MDVFIVNVDGKFLESHYCLLILSNLHQMFPLSCTARPWRPSSFQRDYPLRLHQTVFTMQRARPVLNLYEQHMGVNFPQGFLF